jgi:hypothetical protein
MAIKVPDLNLVNTISKKDVVLLSQYNGGFYLSKSILFDNFNKSLALSALTDAFNFITLNTVVATSSANWNTSNNNFTIINRVSGSWDTAYATVNAMSTLWLSDNGSFISANSSKWDQAYFNTNENSANWNSTETNVKANSGKWNSSYNTVLANSAAWGLTSVAISARYATSADMLDGKHYYNFGYIGKTGSNYYFNATNEIKQFGGGSTVIGQNALSSSDYNLTSDNIAIGDLSLAKCNTGLYNIALGFESLYNLINAEQNIAIGTLAGAGLTTGSFNVIIGPIAGQNNITKNYNILIGVESDISTGVSGAIQFGTGTNFTDNTMQVWSNRIADKDGLALYQGSNISLSKSTSGITISSTGGSSTLSRVNSSFINSDLVSSLFRVTHNFNFKYVNVVVADSLDELIMPDKITFTNANYLDIDLTSFTPICGIWNVAVI